MDPDNDNLTNPNTTPLADTPTADLPENPVARGLSPQAAAPMTSLILDTHVLLNLIGASATRGGLTLTLGTAVSPVSANSSTSGA